MKAKPIQKNHQKILNAIGMYLKEFRYAENLTIKEVSKEIGIHFNTIGNIESAKNYKILTIIKLCDFYEISVSELFSIIE